MPPNPPKRLHWNRFQGKVTWVTYSSYLPRGWAYGALQSTVFTPVDNLPVPLTQEPHRPER